MIKKFLAAAILVSLFIAAGQAQADISIGSTVTSAQGLTALDPIITIDNGGDLVVNTALGHAPIYVDGTALTGLQISVDSGTPTAGIRATGNSFGAIFIDGDNALSSLELNSGIITSNNASLGVVVQLSGAGGTTSISTAAGTTISSTAAYGLGIASSTTSNTDLTITNAGTISVGDDSSSTAIFLGDSDGGSSLTVNNRPIAKRFPKFSNLLNYSQIFPYQTQSLVFAA